MSWNYFNQGDIMRSISVSKFFALLSAVAFSTSMPLASAQHSGKEIKEDVQRHRAMAVAHEEAAKCLESGQKADACVKQLQVACKGLGIGKYCGMRHAH